MGTFGDWLMSVRKLTEDGWKIDGKLMEIGWCVRKLTYITGEIPKNQFQQFQ